GSPIIVRRDGSIDLVESTGPVVGILPTARWRSAVRLLGRGDTLVLYSDGVIEAESPDGGQFGLDGLLRVMRNPTAEAIVEAVEQHEAGARTDDLTLVVVRRP